MDAQHLKDVIARGLGAAARHIGTDCDAFRPVAADRPMALVNRYIRLPAAFATEQGSFRQPVGYNQAGWSGVFDTAYTQPGDYLQSGNKIYFIAAQQDLLPSLCVLTNRVLSIARATSLQGVGAMGYGGITRDTLTPVLTDWPASVLAGGTGGSDDLPGEAGVAHWNTLRPPTPVRIRPADLIRDDTGASYVVISTELSSLGWRLLAKQAES